MPQSIDINVPSEYDIYKISYLVHKGWKREKYNQVTFSKYSHYSSFEPGESQDYAWHKEGFINKDAMWATKKVLITRGNLKGQYKEEEGYIDSPYFTLDQAWRAENEVSK